MFLTDEQVAIRLNSNRNIVRLISDELIVKQHGLKTLERKTIESRLTEEAKTLIGATSQIAGCTETAKAFGISIDHASRLGLGKRDALTVDEEFKEKVNKAADKELAPVRSKAVALLTKALDNITDEKLELLSAVKLVAISKGLSGIVKDTNRDSEDSSKYSFNIFNVPKNRDMDRYETVQHAEVIVDGEAVSA